MLSSCDQLHIRELLCEAMVLLCRNVIQFKEEFVLNAVVDVTVDKNEAYKFDLNNTTYKSTATTAEENVACKPAYRSSRRKKTGGTLSKNTKESARNVVPSSVWMKEVEQLAIRIDTKHKKQDEKKQQNRKQNDDSENENEEIYDNVQTFTNDGIDPNKFALNKTRYKTSSEESAVNEDSLDRNSQRKKPYSSSSTVSKIDKKCANTQSVQSVSLEEPLVDKIDIVQQTPDESKEQNPQQSDDDKSVYDVQEFTVLDNPEDCGDICVLKHETTEVRQQQQLVKEEIEWSFVNKDTLTTDVLCPTETALAGNKDVDFEQAIIQVESQDFMTNDKVDMASETTVVMDNDSVVGPSRIVQLVLPTECEQMEGEVEDDQLMVITDSQFETSLEGLHLVPGETFEYNGTTYKVASAENDLDISMHIKTEHEKVSIKDNIMRKGNHTRSKKPKPFMCAICPQQFTTHWGLKLHERLHRGDYRFYCKVCNKGFITSCNLRGHMAKHTRQKDFACEYCGKSFAFRQSLERHKQHKDNNTPCKGLKQGKNQMFDGCNRQKKVLQIKQEETADLSVIQLDPVR